MSTQHHRLIRIADILKKDQRYRLEAYLFVIEGLNFELKKIGLSAPDKHRHLTACELLDGIKQLAWERYGRLAKEVFAYWGVRSTADFGEIVFNLIEAGEFSKTEDDKKEDFANIFDFEDLIKTYPIGEGVAKI